MSKEFQQLVEDEKPPCTFEDPEMFFPSYAHEQWREVEAAKAVCRRCPSQVKGACLSFALHTGDNWAIMGGTTPAERQQMNNNKISRQDELALKREQTAWRRRELRDRREKKVA